ncbi:MFS transporter OS=Streptomyces microflavus OX=1919 GN=G3I39_40985 PE=4 SV=1 [Streptomyces microflavus]
MLVLAVLLVAVDATVLGLATPFLSEDLAPTGNQLLWIGDVYSFVIAGLLVSMGSLGDRIGRKSCCWSVPWRHRRGLRAQRVRDHARDDDRGPGAPRCRGGHPDAVHRRPDPQPLPRPARAQSRHRHLGRVPRRRALPSAPSSADSCSQPFWWGSVFLINLRVMAVLVVVGIKMIPGVAEPGARPVGHAQRRRSPLVGMIGVV